MKSEQYSRAINSGLCRFVLRYGILFVLAFVQAEVVFAAKLYKWIDENGNVHYSDRLPPSLTKKEHKELNDQGVIMKTVAREKDNKEVQQEELEAERLAEERREAQAKLAKQNMLDKILLDTFTTEQDLVLTRDERLGMIDSIINLTISNNHRLQEQIDAAKAQIAALENNNREVPENFRKKLVNLNGQFKKNADFVAAKQKERDALKKQFERDLNRYRELKHVPAEEAQPNSEEEKSASANSPIASSDSKDVLQESSKE